MSSRDLLKAVWFATEKHRTQRRKGDDSPYINHPVGVAWILQHEAGVNDQLVLEGALLHDTVEDTDTTFEELEREFGREIRDLVDEVTDNKALSKDERKRMQIQHAGEASDRAKLIKMADKLYNYRALLKVPPKGWDASRIQGYFVWGSFVTRRCAGVNQTLDEILESFYQGTFQYHDQTFPILPPGDLSVLLEQYLNEMSKLSN